MPEPNENKNPMFSNYDAPLRGHGLRGEDVNPL